MSDTLNENNPKLIETEAGALPQDWKVINLKELISKVEYGSSTKSETEGQVPVIRMGNIQNGKIILEGLVYTNIEQEIEKYKLKYNDVLFNRTNTIELVGKTGIYKSHENAIFAGYLIRIHIDKEKLNPDYLTYYINTAQAKRHGRLVLSIAVGQANINGEKLKSYPIPLPPTLAEQERIATVLSDTDALIESLEKIIEKKKWIKQGAMQELLTGKRRLPGFGESKGFKRSEVGRIPEDWEVKKLGEVAILQGGYSFKSEKFSLDGIPIIRISDIINEKIKTNNSVFYQDFKIAESFIVLQGDLLIAMSGATTGKIGLYEDNKIAYLNQRVGKFSILDLKKINRNFLYQFTKSKQFKDQVELSIAQGAQPNISGKDIEKFQIPLPPTPAEQESIATILSDMDTELKKLEKKLEKTKDLKQGLIQQLLTGKIRLV